MQRSLESGGCNYYRMAAQWTTQVGGNSMRTSGASSETNLTIVTVVVAAILTVYLFGGPSEFLLASEKLLRSVAEGLGGMVRAFQS